MCRFYTARILTVVCRAFRYIKQLKEESVIRVAIVGIGGVGGYFGGKLAAYYASRDDVEVVFIARGEHLKKIRENGLQQITQEGTFTVHPDIALDDPSGAGIFDIVLVCVKRYSLQSAAEMIRENIGSGSVVISLLNGVDNVDPLALAFPRARVLNGCVYIGAFVEQPGVVRQVGGSCQLFFGSEDGDVKGLKEIESVLKSAGIKAELSADIRKVVWEKYLFVSPLATATTYLKEPIGAFVEKTEKRTFLEGLMREVAAIGNAMGIPISADMIEEALDKNSLFPYDTKTSMQLDFEKARQTEIELFTGYVVRRGKELGIDTPLHGKAYAALLDLI